MYSWHVLLVLVPYLSNQALSMYVKIYRWEKRCFVEDVPDSTLITYQWMLHLFNDKDDSYDDSPSKEGNMQLTITSPTPKKTDSNRGDTGTLRQEQHLTNGTGKVNHYAADYGQYEFCFVMLPTTTGAYKARFHVDVKRQYRSHADEQEMVEEARDYIVENLDKATKYAKFIRMEQLHYKAREEEFRDISYLTSTRVVWYGLITALTLISTGCFMVANLKSFFIAKKLV